VAAVVVVAAAAAAVVVEVTTQVDEKTSTQGVCGEMT
jgi:hypothetical protein